MQKLEVTNTSKEVTISLDGNTAVITAGGNGIPGAIVAAGNVIEATEFHGRDACATFVTRFTPCAGLLRRLL
jgi:hypothetical protein